MVRSTAAWFGICVFDAAQTSSFGRGTTERASRLETWSSQCLNGKYPGACWSSSFGIPLASCTWTFGQSPAIISLRVKGGSYSDVYSFTFRHCLGEHVLITNETVGSGTLVVTLKSPRPPSFLLHGAERSCKTMRVRKVLWRRKCMACVWQSVPCIPLVMCGVRRWETRSVCKFVLEARWRWHCTQNVTTVAIDSVIVCLLPTALVGSVATNDGFL